MEQLALLGGPKAKRTPFGTGKRFGQEELAQLAQALEQNTLFYWAGGKTRELCERFARLYGMPHCVATSSCTAAVHVALGTLGVSVGDEVIVSPITDMGSLIGILYQNAIPIFADLDPFTYNMTAQTIAACVTQRTKAVVVVHLAGNPADMDPIVALCREKGIRLIEDCAQSYLAMDKGRLAGTMGDAGCFSLNDFKHISAGDGGMVLLREQAAWAKALRFADKNYDRLSGDAAAMRKIEYLAPNYRMNELTAAVGIAQLEKLPGICRRRHAYGERLTAGLAGLPGLITPHVRPGCESSYWFYMFRLQEQEAGVSRAEFCRALAAEGVPSQAGYIPACVYEYDLFKNKNAYPGTDCPFGCRLYGREVDYHTGLCPTAEEILRTAVRLSVSEFYTDEDCDQVIEAVRKVSRHFAG